MSKIGIVTTTFLRDELLFKSIQSLIDNYQPNWEIIIVDQGNDSDTKSQWLTTLPSCIHYNKLPFNLGLSKSRNYGVWIAKQLDCNYTLLSSDSFLFNESIQKLDNYVNYLESNRCSLIGFELTNCICGWEATMELIKGEGFELDFIDKSNNQSIYDVDICRNLFLANTKALFNVKWDQNLLLTEHEDFFYRFKQYGYKCKWTNDIIVEKMTDRPNEYSNYRKENFHNGREELKKKYNISGWVTYKNLERAKYKP